MTSRSEYCTKRNTVHKINTTALYKVQSGPPQSRLLVELLEPKGEVSNSVARNGLGK